MTRSLPENTRLQTLKREARRWLKTLRAGDPEALARFDKVAGRPWNAGDVGDVQRALAQGHGFTTWANLERELETAQQASQAPDELADTLLELASLHYGVPPGTDAIAGGYADSPARRQRALDLFEAHPEIGRANIHTASLCGGLAHVQSLLSTDPGLASRTGGKEGWPPLLFVCYGRLPVPAAADNAVAIARALLDCGADPNAHWRLRWQGAYMPWSAVCGAMGDGEPGRVRTPPHPRADELVTLLLDRGAQINQGQALYNTMLRRDDDRWLRLFIERGLTAAHQPGWEAQGPPPAIFSLLLHHAAKTNQVRRAALLLEHGARPNAGGEDLHRLAMKRGNVEVAELLERHGVASPGPADDHRAAFVAACQQRDRALASKLLAQDSGLLEYAADLLIDTAAARDLVDLAEILLELGVSPNAEKGKDEGGYRALHHAATMNAVNVTRLLLDRGAEVDPRDSGYRATPLAWAIKAQAPATLELLASRSRDVFSMVAGGLEPRLRELLRDPAIANAALDDTAGLGVIRGQPGDTPLFVLPEDEQRALSIAELLLRSGADPGRRNRHGLTAVEKARARGLRQVADLLAAKCLQ